ncbi:hypothetical protein PIROE2DRAFT_57535 [Piromyces sp. E2]|nr:hypothetical protein PIROE2DRAFT_57535 [Piromyces sp. E2]|eukprot:OUM69332.1 hypothetical protein PIROE2DRAFT_57535 [Piromyces sp. E2]
MSITIYDLKNKYIAYTESFTEEFIREDQNDINSKFVEKKGAIRCICSEWGSLFIFTGDRKMYRLEEIDLSTKLDILFKRNMYTLAINIVNSQQQYSNVSSNPTLNLEGMASKEGQEAGNNVNNSEYDYGTLVEIYKRYGDWLYEKNDFDNAMKQYLHTIGQLEPSYVIRKFLDAQRIHNLTSYLQALHEAGLANSDHTTLLLNCYTKLKSKDALDQFIKSEKNVTFDVDTAINVCRQAGYFEHAIYLAEEYKYYDLYINIQVEDLHHYHDVIAYMQNLPFKIVENNINHYGVELVTNIPEHTTELLIKLCTGWNDENETEESKSGEEITTTKTTAQSLLSHVVTKYRTSTKTGKDSTTTFTITPSSKLNVETKDILPQDNTSQLNSFMINNDEPFEVEEKSRLSVNPNQTHLSSFPPFQSDNILDNEINIIGSINAATALKNEDSFQINASEISNISRSFQSQVNFTLDEDRFNKNNIIDLSMSHSPKLEEEKLNQKRDGKRRKNARMADAESFIYLYINQKEWCITFLETVLEKRLTASDEDDTDTEILDSNDNQIIWNTLLELYLSGTTEAFKKTDDYTEDDSVIKWEPLEGKIMSLLRNPKDTETMRQQIDELKNGNVIFQVSKCEACGRPLELPTIHFLCKHSYHLRCLGENDQACPKCTPEHRMIMDAIRLQESNTLSQDVLNQQKKKNNNDNDNKRKKKNNNDNNN